MEKESRFYFQFEAYEDYERTTEQTKKEWADVIVIYDRKTTWQICSFDLDYEILALDYVNYLNNRYETITGRS